MGETHLGELKVKTLFENISVIKDPRIERQKRHCLTDILVIVICATETWEDIEEFGHAKREWLTTFSELENVIPSHDTFRRVFISAIFKDYFTPSLKVLKF